MVSGDDGDDDPHLHQDDDDKIMENGKKMKSGAKQRAT